MVSDWPYTLFIEEGSFTTMGGIFLKPTLSWLLSLALLTHISSLSHPLSEPYFVWASNLQQADKDKESPSGANTFAFQGSAISMN